ncbi:hypothetical protein BC941DRAFT_416369 [Chlamydoabsidia padenii]|nr:hypothetical protein BC941DRAFT_416369 [Chlamydoabsidia padenii]
MYVSLPAEIFKSRTLAFGSASLLCVPMMLPLSPDHHTIAKRLCKLYVKTPKFACCIVFLFPSRPIIYFIILYKSTQIPGYY